MQYYKQKQFIAQVDENDTIIQPVERWSAHKKGILHRGLTVSVYYQDAVLLQHRKHPIFDNTFDMTVSTHQIYQNNELENDMAAIERMLARELGIAWEDMKDKPKKQGVVQYSANDPNSEYTEHEICHVYTCSVNALPSINRDYAYGFSLQKYQKLKQPNNTLRLLYTPWVHEMLKT